ncbi:diaminopimelate decarboxylase [Schaalia sp. Marseille-Q2122]|uniref:diaminopimelate decarboxylase n=1 Tax=Schaalia sp. Marseille-Q2122 TaxID=2736604 RepID=UPI0020CA7B53|nr:diaminopimelate decarboxylase [Schaalia sp. Marseille-Q2122]
MSAPSASDAASSADALPVGALVCPEPDQRPDLWPWTATRDEDGALELGGCALPELADTYGTPLFVMDRADLRGRANVWATAMAEEFWDGYGMAGGDAFYAGKAFLCADVVRTVTECGMGVDTASLGELTLALRAGADPRMVGLHGNNKTEAELEVALRAENAAGERAGIARIFLDSPWEVGQVEAIAARLGVVVPVMVRVKTGIHAGGNDYIATSHEDQKFGVSVAGGEAIAVAEAVLASEHLELRGFHNHIGSQIIGTEAFEAAARIVMALRAELAERTGVCVPEIDLGGGVGIAYTGRDPEPTSPVVVARALASIVREESAAAGVPVPHVSVEPGRSVVGPTMVTLYRVGAIKDVTIDEDGRQRRYVSIDGGMSDNIRPALYGAHYTAPRANRRCDGPVMRCRVVGKHCESGDIVVHEVDLPADLRAGDLLVVPATGAYGRSMASNYNLLTRPGVLAVEGGRAQWALRPETLEDLYATDPALA